MFDFITNFFKPMSSEPENTVDVIDPAVLQKTPEQEIDLADDADVVPLLNDQLDLIASVLKEVVYLYTQTGAAFSSELQERIRQAQELLEH